MPQGGEQHADGREHRGPCRAETPPSAHGGSSLHFRRTVLSEYEKFPGPRLNPLPVIHVTPTPGNSRRVALDCLPKEVRL
ncbi:hypothetical protein GCM10010233_26100 [Streptomyces pseudogriseolus]|nr:hypothetical protein GCM10010233_26100 [Streptomyces gancidicus]